MARISIDDELHAHRGFKRLVKALGSEDQAVGMLYRFWRDAQNLWGDGRLMSESDFTLDGLTPILEAGLAEKRPEGIYACGAEERFAWYIQKKEASKKGVAARLVKPKTSSGQPEQVSGQPESLPGQPIGSTGAHAPDNPSLLSAPAPLRFSPHRTVSHLSAPDLGGEIKKCMDDWKETLAHFGIERNLSERDEVQIARAIQSHSAEWVKLAFLGARKQTKGKGFDPKQFVSLSIYLHKDKIERLVNIGSGKETVEGIDWSGFFGDDK